VQSDWAELDLLFHPAQSDCSLLLCVGRGWGCGDRGEAEMAPCLWKPLARCREREPVPGKCNVTVTWSVGSCVRLWWAQGRDGFPHGNIPRVSGEGRQRCASFRFYHFCFNKFFQTGVGG
jgi:hypothetical protein